MSKYQKLAQEIVKEIGGAENITELTHCVTRLRFHLKDDSIPNDEVIKNMDGVVTVVRSGGQYQVVIGNQVSEVYGEVNVFAKRSEGALNDTKETKAKKKKPLDAFIDVISGLFQPILGILCAAGMLKGFNTLFSTLGVYSADSGTYMVINAMGDALFMFLPVFLGYTSAIKFKVQPFIGLLIGLAMCYPAIQLDALAGSREPLYTLFSGSVLDSPVYLDLFGIPLISMNYTSTVLPIIIVVYFASKVQNILDKIVPSVIKFFMVPMVTVLVSLSLGFLLIGPVASYASELIAQGILAVRETSPLFAGFLLGLLWQVLIVFGLHWGIVPLYINNMTTMGYDTIMASVFATSFSQMAIVIAIIIKTKDKNLKALGIPAAISALFGITEPVVYGITLPRKKLFIMSCIVSGVAGGFYGLYNLREFTFGGLGVFEFLTMIDPNEPGVANIMIAVIGVVFAMIVSFGLTLVMFKDENKEPKTKEVQNTVIESSTSKKHTMFSPMDGEIFSIKEVKDEAFSQELLGKGIAIRPSTGVLSAPFDGKVVTLFPTKHAVGLVSDEGMEILIHVGFNTVRLKGKHFEAFVQEGDIVKKGQKMVVFDKEAIEKEGFSLETPIIVTNTFDYLEVIETKATILNAGEVLLTGLL
ncbi:beta-glucoside-specific PTS transporter subunit IIABC [Paenibacillus typhae]|uniref:PTS system beta-glucoside-specific IIA component, Glc family /PTS system beta-glucoside-specific IIB component, Glc family /PTS system beta-glucoside-specific IIC component, Glc family n=1 Tax=Paenibacillus typhae TaxID=1174501 RepID=A0A1G8F735_9BACL|nr:beta-glucoside-specific PTS transporter subunit IIABC [Paenibacillus typhae]SDH77956.1 PTS system beta-glucoside-specific IIA component, Glc family /PTS system beta-glucoside-specific IIB component, Glc family /PTS system beta-glucoside-specific IIC component, Glc family [Paenibacillus typhae]